MTRRGSRGGRPWITGKAHGRATARLRVAHPDEFARYMADAIAELEAEDAAEREEDGAA